MKSTDATRRELPTLHPGDRAVWRAWLEEHHARSTGVWLVYWKKSSGRQGLSYAAAVEEALCFGWIDGQVESLDAERYRQRYTPRKPRSVWSALNKRRIALLEASGRMTAAGLRAMEVAKANGSWASLDEVEALVVPPWLVAALSERARAHFDALSPSRRKAFLYFLGTVKGEAARQRRLETVVALLDAGQTMDAYYFGKDAAARLAERTDAARRATTMEGTRTTRTSKKVAKASKKVAKASKKVAKASKKVAKGRR